MLVYYFVPFIVSNRYLLFRVTNGHNSVTAQNRTHVYMNFFDHKDLGNHLLQLCPKVVKHPVYIHSYVHEKCQNYSKFNIVHFPCNYITYVAQCLYLLIIAPTCFCLRPGLSSGCEDGQELRPKLVGAIINK